MKAKDIMTTPVVAIGPDTPVTEIAGLLFRRHISGVPVVEDGRVVGLVSEGDLLRRHEIGTDGSPVKRSWWDRLIQNDPALAAYVKSHASYARDIMSRDVVSVEEETPVAEIASLFEMRKIRRVPVLRHKKLVGIVSRANLVQALAVTTKAVDTHDTRTDEEIRKQLLSEVASQPWWQRNPANVIVTDSVVHYRGMVRTEEERQAARIAAENVPGVRKIEDHRIHRADFHSML